MVFTKLQYHTFATFLNNVKAARQPHQHRDNDHGSEALAGIFHAWTATAATAEWTTRATAIAALLAEQAIQPAVEVAP